MRRIEPAFPDLLPITHRLGGVPAAFDHPLLDPVEMRISWDEAGIRHRVGDRVPPRRPVRLVVHATSVPIEAVLLHRLVEAGSGVLIVLDGAVTPEQLPNPILPAQITLMVPWRPELWGGGPIEDLGQWKSRGLPIGVLIALAPTRNPTGTVADAVRQAASAGAEYVVTAPLALPPECRHRMYDRYAGENGDPELENLLFHTDLNLLSVEMERIVSHTCREHGLHEGLPGPATATSSREAFSACTQLFLWARRLDLLDGVASTGWQLRRAAHALLASRRELNVLLAEDNLRIVPGFTPWVEAFARSLWAGRGEPFEGALARWALAPS